MIEIKVTQMYIKEKIKNNKLCIFYIFTKLIIIKLPIIENLYIYLHPEKWSRSFTY